MTPFLSFDQLTSADPGLEGLRQELYDADKPGYVVIPGYIDSTKTNHLRQFWTIEPRLPERFDTHPNARKIIGQRPFLGHFKRRTCYYNYLWNKPVDEISHSICFAVSLLRNQLQKSPLYFNLAPNGKRMASYRVVASGTYSPGEIEVQPHQDFGTEQDMIHEPESQRYLQATLFLSEHGVDYTGDGFFFTTNQGKKMYFGKDLQLKPGDLVIWRYTNEHGVEATQKSPEGVGFLRMVFPNEEIHVPEVFVTKPKGLQKTLHKMSNLFASLKP